MIGRCLLHCAFSTSLPKMGAVSNLMTLVLILMAGLMGASGVILAAAAAHAKSGMGLDGAGYLLLFHAVAVLSGSLWLPFWRCCAASRRVDNDPIGICLLSGQSGL